MKRTFYALAALLLVSFVATGCLSDDDDTTTSLGDNCYISVFTLGTMKRTLHTTSSTGADSTYTTTFTGSLYKMSVNQRELTITNPEPLPTGTQVKAVLVTLTNKGTVAYRQETDSATWKAYSSTDSIDFTLPLTFRVYAEDVTIYRDYRVTLNVLEADADEYTWTQLPDAASLAARTKVRLNATGDTPLILSSDANNVVYVTRPVVSGEETTWEDKTCTGADNADVQTLNAFGGQLWMSTTDGRLLRSDDGEAWTEVAQGTGISIRLVAASDQALYACRTDVQENTPFRLVASADGTTWDNVGADADLGLFPEDAASVAYTQTNGNARVLVAGPIPAEPDKMAVWNLLEGGEEPWTLFATTGDNDYVLPRLAPLSIVAYDKKLAVFGITVGESTNEAVCYVSQDNGITWKTDDYLTLPSGLDATTATRLAATAEGEYIWLTAGTQVWRGRLNGYK